MYIYIYIHEYKLLSYTHSGIRETRDASGARGPRPLLHAISHSK